MVMLHMHLQYVCSIMHEKKHVFAICHLHYMIGLNYLPV